MSLNIPKPDQPRWFLLYGGTSPDGLGQATYAGRTMNPAFAAKFAADLKTDPHSTGYVEVVTDSKIVRMGA